MAAVLAEGCDLPIPRRFRLRQGEREHQVEPAGDRSVAILAALHGIGDHADPLGGLGNGVRGGEMSRDPVRAEAGWCLTAPGLVGLDRHDWNL